MADLLSLTDLETQSTKFSGLFSNPVLSTFLVNKLNSVKGGLAVSLFKLAVLISQELSIPHNPRNLSHSSSQPIHMHPRDQSIAHHHVTTPYHPRDAPHTLYEGFCPVWRTIEFSILRRQVFSNLLLRSTKLCSPKFEPKT